MIALILAGRRVPHARDGLHRPAARTSPNGSRRSACRRSALIVALTVFYIVLGCFLDGISMVVLTMGVILPTVEKAGIDLLWFGIFIVLVVEMAQITPPVGFNLFVLQGMTRQARSPGSRGATLPFFFLMVAAVLLICFFPQLVTLLPAQMRH